MNYNGLVLLPSGDVMSCVYSCVRSHKVLKVYLYLEETGALMGAVISAVSRELNYSNRFIRIALRLLVS